MPANEEALSSGQFGMTDLYRGVPPGDDPRTEVFVRDGQATDGHHPDGHDGDHRLGGRPLDPRLRELEDQVMNLQAALQTQRLISVVVGMIAYRIGRPTDEAWALLARLSQQTNVKVREVARVICEAFDGHGRAEDAALLAQLIGLLSESTADDGRRTD